MFDVHRLQSTGRICSNRWFAILKPARGLIQIYVCCLRFLSHTFNTAEPLSVFFHNKGLPAVSLLWVLIGAVLSNLEEVKEKKDKWDRFEWSQSQVTASRTSKWRKMERSFSTKVHACCKYQLWAMKCYIETPLWENSCKTGTGSVAVY